MTSERITTIVLAVQGIRETVERHWDETGSEDLWLAYYVLGKVEEDLFDVWDALDEEEIARRERAFTVL